MFYSFGIETIKGMSKTSNFLWSNKKPHGKTGLDYHGIMLLDDFLTCSKGRCQNAAAFNSYVWLFRYSGCS